MCGGEEGDSELSIFMNKTDLGEGEAEKKRESPRNPPLGHQVELFLGLGGGKRTVVVPCLH